MRKGLTELVMIIDRSGSMHGLEQDTIGGYNSMLEEQKRVDGKVFVSTVLFNQMPVVVHDRSELGSVKPMTEQDYRTGGMTALLDAFGGAIHHIANIHKYAREEDRPEKTIFVVITDGYENASRRYNYETVKKMVEKERDKYGWEFIFLGANMDAIETAGRFGIHADRAATYNVDEKGVELNYKVLSETVACMRTSAAPVGAKWKEAIERDKKTRRQGR
ncbi:MAG: hypothetical protein IJL97_00170 [Lachnospiraceae bacterium]|nr:hypothetical protein [Lachnospiraceae bacterium]